MKSNILSVLLSLIILTGCASSPGLKLPADTVFSVESLKVNLTQKLQVEGYPKQAEFTELLKQKLNASLKAKGLLADSGASNIMSVSLVVDYQRRFAGEDTPIPSKSVMSPVINYVLIVSDKGVEKKRIVKNGLKLTKGFAGNMVSVATLGLGKDAKDEIKDLETFTDFIAAELKDLK